jgi:hypothetical protein
LHVTDENLIGAILDNPDGATKQLALRFLLNHFIAICCEGHLA